MRNVSVGQRLAISFLGMVLLMGAGSAIAIQRTRAMAAMADRVYQADLEAVAASDLHNRLLELKVNLQTALNLRRRIELIEAATKNRYQLLSDIDRSVQSLRSRPEDAIRRPQIIGTLESVRTSIMTQLSAIVELAEVRDWTAVQLRLDFQMGTALEITGALVDQINADAAGQRAKLLADIHREEQDAILIVLLTGAASLLAAVFLGYFVTRGIALPVRRLDAAARALAQGDFGYRIAHAGGGELGRLARVFNESASQLQSAYTELRSSQNLLQSLVENTTNAVSVVDLDGRFLLVNRRFEEVFAPGRGPLLGQRERDVLAPAEAEVSGAHNREVLDAGEGIEKERLVKCGGESRTFLSVRFPLRSPDRTVYALCSVMTEVTERVRLEEQLNQSRKMEAIGRLAGGVAHDFNNLLTIINGYTALALDTADGNAPSLTGMLSEISKAGARAATLTQQLLSFSRRQTAILSVLNLNAVIVGLETMLLRMTGEGIQLETIYGPDLEAVQADPSQIELVIVNLVINARDAMTDGGVLTLETANVEASETSPAKVMLAVRDIGCGMDQETQSRAFEPFFTTRAVGKGTGLGLSIVYGIVQQAGGQIWLDSEPGKGTVFRVLFPRCANSAVVLAVPVEDVPRQGKETILVVEDEEALRALMSAVLRSLGYNVLAAANGREALGASQQFAGRIDALITDVIMPGINGEEVASSIRLQRENIRVLFVSGYHETGVQEATGDGTRFLAKPFTPATLGRRVRELLDGAV